MKNENLNTKEFISKSKNVHIKNDYDYSLVDYTHSKEKVKIIHIICGSIFEQTPNKHLLGRRCPKCYGTHKYSNKEFISKAKNVQEKFGRNYNYSLVDYKGNKIKVKIICDEHGVFEQKPNSHLLGIGCDKCGKIEMAKKKSLKKEEIIKRMTKNHKINAYDYSLVDYKTIDTKVKIICNQCKSIFKQTPNAHINQKQGCPKCKSSKGENEIRSYLQKNNIEFEEQKYFKELGKSRYDFFLPKLNTLLEYDGVQHFEPVKYFGGEERFVKNKYRDEIKNQFAFKNGIRLIRIAYTDFNKIEKLLNESLMKAADQIDRD